MLSILLAGICYNSASIIEKAYFNIPRSPKGSYIFLNSLYICGSFSRYPFFPLLLFFLLFFSMTRLSKHKKLQKKKAEVARSARHSSVTFLNTILDLPTDYL